MNSPRSILVTGASSYVGARVYADIQAPFSQRGISVIGTFCSNQLFPALIHLDLSDPYATKKLVKELTPEWIVHVAAIPNQAGCDKDQAYAQQVNIEGARTLVEVANAIAAKIIFISSESAYEETLYGKLKGAGEEIIKNTRSGHVILQPAMIFGLSPNTTNDRPYNRLLRAIEKKIPTSFDADLKFYPTWVHHLSEVVQAVIERDIRNETIAVVGDRLSSRYEMATHVLQPFGIEVQEDHSNNPGSGAPLTQESLIRLGLPCYSTDMVIEQVVKETIEHLSRERHAPRGS
jgi:dTDP-4-dehydrorhamnose reductase